MENQGNRGRRNRGGGSQGQPRQGQGQQQGQPRQGYNQQQGQGQPRQDQGQPRQGHDQQQSQPRQRHGQQQGQPRQDQGQPRQGQPRQGQPRQGHDQQQGQQRQRHGQPRQGQGQQQQQRQQGQQQQQGQQGQGQQQPQQASPPQSLPSSGSSTPKPSSAASQITQAQPAEARSFETKARIDPKVAQMRLKQIPKRKNPNQSGTKGRRIQVEANVMAIKFGQKFCKAIHYDVAINPDTPKCLMHSVMEEFKRKHYPQRFPAFDGRKNLFSSTLLPFESLPFEDTVTVPNSNNKPKEFKVKVDMVNEVDMTWLKNVRPGFSDNEREIISIQVLDIVLRAAPASRAITVGRSFFTPPAGRVVELGEGLELWVGTFQSAILGWKPFLNVDVAHKGFPVQQPVMDAMKEIATRPRDDPRNTDLRAVMNRRDDVKRFLSGLRVEFMIPNKPETKRTWKIVELSQPPRMNEFELENPQTHAKTRMTVERYFLSEKRYKLQYPDWPCLWVQPKEKNIHIPVELCKIIGGQVTNKKLTENQTANMVKAAATATDVRKDKILKGFDKMRYNDNPSMREFDISVNNEFEVVDARVLEAPTLEYGNKRTERVTKGTWRPSAFMLPSNMGGEGNLWTILSLDRYINDQTMQNLYESLRGEGRRLGMNVADPQKPFGSYQVQPNPQNTLKTLQSYFTDIKNKGVKFVIVIIPDKLPAYEIVKQCAELHVGMLTSCLKAQTVTRKLNQSTLVNILLKINAKLNGTNHSFANGSRPECLSEPTMICGADVTHPAPDSADKPSIAAVASSHDPKAFQYNIEIRLQPPRAEMISDLEQIMVNQLKFFYIKTKQKPNKIIFYRDGVSEGQFPQVMEHEITAIQKACKRLQADYQPKITFLVVQKRHHIRFFPTDKRNSDDRNFNVQAGTIVDTMITHPEHIDFYLVSHASIQGTARPTKYRCLWDDNNMSEDEIERMTYYLCHIFSRCTRSVSYPAPTYYAHLSAFRARALTHNVRIALDQLSDEQTKKLTIKEEVLKGRPMFFV